MIVYGQMRKFVVNNKINTQNVLELRLCNMLIRDIFLRFYQESLKKLIAARFFMIPKIVVKIIAKSKLQNLIAQIFSVIFIIKKFSMRF